VPIVDVGAEPSVVYRIDAPAVADEIVTDIGLENVPGTGLKVGAATTGGTNVYVPFTTALSIMPPAYAIARKVVVALMGTAPEYRMPAVDVGVEPSVVYRIDAPAVVEEIVTDIGLANVPGAGLYVGFATVPGA